MTNEDAIKFANRLKNNYTIDFNDMADFCNMAIKALEQQPCDDCVSLGVYKQVIWERDIAIEQLKELGYGFGEKIRTSEDCVSRADVITIIQNHWWNCKDIDQLVKALPPVTPTHKVGKWKSDGYGHIVCTACNEVSVSLWKSKYCPCCGAEMRGIEE